MAKSDKIGQNRTFEALSIEQENAIDLLIQGKSDREVSELVGVSRQTVTSWRNDNVVFLAALNARRQEVFGENVERLRWLLSEAVDIIAAGLQSDDEKIRLQTAWSIYRSVERPTGKTSAGAVEAEKKMDEILNFGF